MFRISYYGVVCSLEEFAAKVEKTRADVAEKCQKQYKSIPSMVRETFFTVTLKIFFEFIGLEVFLFVCKSYQYLILFQKQNDPASNM